MLQAITSDPADAKLRSAYTLILDLATGVTTPHANPDHIENAGHSPIEQLQNDATLPASVRADEPLPEKLT